MLLAAAAAVAFLVQAAPAAAHCDSLTGPVVADARAALEAGEVARVLRWVSPEDEAEVAEAFRQALAVRELNAEARALADRFFFETTVRLHRSSEGEPYTGVKDVEVDPILAAADAALESGSAHRVISLVVKNAEARLRQLYAAALARKAHADESVELGRRYVAAYAEFMKAVEQLAIHTAEEEDPGRNLQPTR